uniref:Uncharacterized protein n=1 Tax=Avena sativa TaxID=4498 RepID=A0ACD5UDI1_AVESA
MHTKMRTAMALLVLAAFLLPLATAASAVTTARRNCSTCGYDDIPYPFGVGPSCSLPGFSLTCAVNTDKSGYLLLGNSSMEVGIPTNTSNQFLYANISHSVEMIPGVRDYSVHWEAPARPFALSGSSNMSLFVVGCGVKASLFVGNSSIEVGNCSAICGEAQVMEKLPADTCYGIGCCFIDIQVNLRAFTINISRTSDSARSNKVYAFISGDKYQSFVPIDALRSTLPAQFKLDEYLELDEYAALEWAIPYQPNCKRALEDNTSYACVANRSKCKDSHIGGYFCYCQWGDGNPYVAGGCPEYQPLTPPPGYYSIQPRPDCPTSCGNVSTPFPFGTELGCFAKPHMYLKCNPTEVLPILQLNDRTLVTDISIDDGVLHVHEISKKTGDLLSDSDPALYAMSEEWGMDRVVTWAIDNTTCEDAKLDKGDYRCFTSHSDCVDVTEDRTTKHSGYRCRCSSGFEGNPYIRDGCTDINECLQPDKYICNGICQNSVGSYACASCRHGSDFNIVTRGCKPSTVILGVTIGLSSGGGILFLAAIVAILTRRWKRSVQKRLRRRHFQRNRGILLEQLISSDKSAGDNTKIFSLEELQKATNNFDHSRVVGRGGHGTVYKGILTDQRVVAIKKSTLVVISEIEQFINEVSILSQINHRNVVKLHGCCLESEVPLLVYEFISSGTLYNLLHCKQDGTLLPLSWEERLRISTEIAGALTYLHSEASVSILHRDVKCMNVLLNDSCTAKVSDFGASRLIPIDQTHLVTAVQGTFGYLDPEYYHTGQLNEKSDVYSFGVILVELLTRRKPIIQNEHGEKQNLSNHFLWAMRERPLEEIVDAQILEEGVETIDL